MYIIESMDERNIDDTCPEMNIHVEYTEDIKNEVESNYFDIYNLNPHIF